MTSDNDSDFSEFELVDLAFEGADKVGVEFDLVRARGRNGDESFDSLSELEP